LLKNHGGGGGGGGGGSGVNGKVARNNYIACPDRERGPDLLSGRSLQYLSLFLSFSLV
jgi:hypothetical protein